MKYFNRNNKKITKQEHQKLTEDDDYCEVKVTELPNDQVLSTVWLGIAHQSWRGIRIFETALITFTNANEDNGVIDILAYHETEQEVLKYHDTYVKNKEVERRQVMDLLSHEQVQTLSEVAYELQRQDKKQLAKELWTFIDKYDSANHMTASDFHTFCTEGGK